jgi:hypothetical protein
MPEPVGISHAGPKQGRCHSIRTLLAGAIPLPLIAFPSVVWGDDHFHKTIKENSCFIGYEIDYIGYLAILQILFQLNGIGRV